MNAAPLFAVPAAIALALVPIPPRVVEAIYSRAIYATLQPVLTFASNRTSVALLDVFALLVIAVFIALSVRDARHNAVGGAIVRIALRALVWSAVLYIWFAVAWGFNYRREQLRNRVAFDAAAISPIEAARLTAAAVDRVNALHATAHQDGWVRPGTIDPSLAGALNSVARDLGASPGDIVVGRPKESLLDWYFQRAGVSGMTDPFFLETLVASDVLPFERPLVTAHEWAHLAGLADEGEANLAGWLACTRGSIADQYSGWLFMYGESVAALPASERALSSGRLAEGPRSDLRAIRDRTLAHVNPQMSAAGWRVYDSYLKANRVQAGTASYSEVVRLALGLEIARRARTRSPGE